MELHRLDQLQLAKAMIEDGGSFPQYVEELVSRWRDKSYRVCGSQVSDFLQEVHLLLNALRIASAVDASFRQLSDDLKSDNELNLTGVLRVLSRGMDSPEGPAEDLAVYEDGVETFLGRLQEIAELVRDVVSLKNPTRGAPKLSQPRAVKAWAQRFGMSESWVKDNVRDQWIPKGLAKRDSDRGPVRLSLELLREMGVDDHD